MSNYRPRTITLQTAIGPMLWGTNYWIATELLPAGRPLLAATGRALPAGILLVAATRNLPPRGWRLRIAALSILNVGVFFVLLFVAAERLPGGVAAAAGAIAPIVVLLVGWPVLGIRPERAGLAAGVAGVVGVGALVLGPAASLDAIGAAAAVGSAASMASATVLARRWGRPPISLVSLTAWQLVLGGLLVAPFSLLVEGAPPAPSVRNALGFVLIGAFGTALAHGLWFRGIAAIPASAITFLGLLSPVVATAIGWLALGQSLTPPQLGGAALVVVAVVGGQRAALAHGEGGREPHRAARRLERVAARSLRVAEPGRAGERDPEQARTHQIAEDPVARRHADDRLAAVTRQGRGGLAVDEHVAREDPVRHGHRGREPDRDGSRSRPPALHLVAQLHGDDDRPHSGARGREGDRG
jgi:probable blue pigment (indigoidine) exporter